VAIGTGGRCGFSAGSGKGPREVSTVMSHSQNNAAGESAPAAELKKHYRSAHASSHHIFPCRYCQAGQVVTCRETGARCTSYRNYYHDAHSCGDLPLLD
jgi:hypothetical protein